MKHDTDTQHSATAPPTSQLLGTGLWALLLYVASRQRARRLPAGRRLPQSVPRRAVAARACEGPSALAGVMMGTVGFALTAILLGRKA